MSGHASLDCSLDENSDQLNVVPICHSTPQKPKNVPNKNEKKQSQNQMTCPYCGKKYVVKHYFLKHLEIHKTSQVPVSSADSTRTHDNSLIVHLDASDVSFSRLTLTPNPDTSSTDTGTFRVPAAPATAPAPLKKKQVFTKTKKKPKLFCTYCLKGYVCSKSFKTHIRTHIIQDAASCFPNTTEIIEHSVEIGMRALQQVSNGPCIGEFPTEFRELVGYVVSVTSGEDFKKFTTDICTQMIKSISKVKFLLPSALINGLMEDQEDILSDPDICDGFLKILNVETQFSADVCAQFFLKFLLFFTTELLRYISRTFKENHPHSVRRRVVSEPDKEDRQVIYYIAGSIMCGYVKIGRRFPNNKTWQQVVSVLKSKVLVDKPEGDLSLDAEWTTDVDRGGLLFINTKCQKLFVSITKIVFSSEKQDGSLDYDATIKEVLNSELSTEWDNIVSDSLSETISLNLLSDVVQCLCRTCGRGIARRRLNFIRRRPVASMTIRHVAASRKNR